jgi:hypothetical protein
MSRHAGRAVLTRSELDAARVAASLWRCFPCGAACRPVAFGVFTHPSNPRSMVYPMCRACASDWADPGQRQTFAEAVHRRFVKLGEVRP